MVGADAAQLGLRGVGADPGEEDTHFGLPAAHAQLAGSPDAEPGPGEERDGRVEDVVREPTWTDVSGFRLAAVHALVRYPRSQGAGPAGGRPCWPGPAAGWPGGWIAVASKQLAEYGKSASSRSGTSRPAFRRA